MRYTLKNQMGVALLEVLIASIVLGIAVAGLALMFSWGQTFVVAQGDNRVALYLATQKLEELKSLPYANLTVGGTSESITAGLGGGQIFTRETCVKNVDDTTLGEPAVSGCPGSATRTKRITVTVTPTMRQADAVTLETVVTNH